jgi:hypothetical protein
MISSVADLDPHIIEKPDPHQRSQRPEPDPQQSQKPGAVEAHNRAMDGHLGAMEAHSGAKEAYIAQEALPSGQRLIFSITSMRMRIRIRIEVKSRIQIRIKVKSRIRISIKLTRITNTLTKKENYIILTWQYLKTKSLPTYIEF